MNMWADAFDSMNANDSGFDSDNLSLDQQLTIAEIKALLSISQELSRIHDEGINRQYTQG